MREFSIFPQHGKPFAHLLVGCYPLLVIFTFGLGALTLPGAVQLSYALVYGRRNLFGLRIELCQPIGEMQ